MDKLLNVYEHVILENEIPKVSICCITFNQVKYIKNTLEGFISQKTDFPVEILIHDDASSDGTKEVILEYVNKYPKLFKPILQNENQYSKIGFAFAFGELRRAKGKYIALCEGDDYWIDKYKLKKQVDLIERDSTISLCFHSTYYLNEIQKNKLILNKPKYIPQSNRFNPIDLIKLDSQLITNCTMLFRSEFVNKLPNWVTNATVGDLPLCLYLATEGDLMYIDEPMAVYRVKSEGSWTEQMFINKKRRKLHLKNLLKIWNNFNVYTNKNYHKLITIRKLRIFRAIFVIELTSYKFFRIIYNFKKLVYKN